MRAPWTPRGGGDRLIGKPQDSVLSQLPNKGFRIREGLGPLHFVLRTNLLRDDLFEWSRAIRRLPDDRAELVQVEQSRIAGGHDHHLAVQRARGNFTASSKIERAHFFSPRGIYLWVLARHPVLSLISQPLSNQFPHAAIFGKHQPLDWHAPYELADGLENLINQFWILGEKQDVPQQLPRRLSFAELLDLVLRPLF